MLLKNLKAVVIHNHPIHYKHLLFQEMKRQNLDFVVLFQASQSSIRHEKLPLSDDLYRYRTAWDGPYEEAPAMLRARWTWNQLRQIRPNYLMISGYYAIECWVALAWGILHRAPRFLWFESNEFDYTRYWIRELPKRIFVRCCQGAHVYGKSHRDYLVKLGMRPETVIFKRSVADIEKFDTSPGSRQYRTDGLTRIVSVGRLAPEKNLSVLLRAFARAVRGGASKLRLIVAGTGPDEAALKKLAAELEVAELVDFRGYTPQKDLGALYRAGDFFVFPSTREPWGLVALEAMLCRLPVIISTKCGCAGDMVTPETGWAFDPVNERELAEIFGRLEGISFEQIARMGDAAHDLARGHSAENCAALIARALNQSLGTCSEAGQAQEPTFAG